MKYKFLLIMLVLRSIQLYCQDYTIEELLNLKNQGLISEEDFKILKSELNSENLSEENLYDLNINSKLVSRTYKVYEKNKKYYFPLKEFFKYINFKNYIEKNNELILYLGSSLREVKIELKNTDSVFQENGEIYLETDKFSETFLKTITMSPDELLIRMYLSFDTPGEIKQLLDISKDKLIRKDTEEELIFSSERKLFDLGYARVQLGQNFDKGAGKRGYESSWDGNIGYQGGLLYGQVTADYDLKEEELNTVRLEYDDIWKGHNLDIENRRSGDKREWGVSFYKDKGYYETSGGHVVIRENVPLGSRVELIYMGTPIEIKDEDNGTVEFDNPLIRTDRTYVLRVYEPDGRIYEKEIKTVQDYNLQQKNQVEYRLTVNENSQYDRYTTDVDVFYGITNNLTMGFGYSRDIEDIDVGRDKTGNIKSETKYLDSAKLDLVYGGTYNAVSYIFNLSGTKTLNSYNSYKEIENERKNISLEERYSYKYLNQFNYSKWKLIYEHEEFGDYYDEKNRDKLDLKYDILSNTDVGYVYEIKRYKYDDDEKSKKITIDSDYTWNKYLFSAGTSIDINDSDNNEYRASVYYSGWERLTGRLENVWTKNGDEYESRISLYNNNFGGFLDFTTELAYSKKDKEKVSFKFSMKLDNWLKIDTNLSDDGSRNHRIGVDKVIDLKNPTINLDTMDNSRVKVITFIDGNNNDIYDNNEEIVPGVEVNLGDKVVVTNEIGEGMFYGIGNGVLYDMKVTIKKPSFTLGNNKIKIKSNFSSTIEAYIPIKPMLTMSGNVQLDKGLNLNADEKIEFYNDLIIELKDLNGNVVETAAPDNEGLFDMSGLFPKEYYIEVTYVGTKYDLKTIREEIELQYSKESSVNTVLLKISNDNIAINTSEFKKNMARLRR
ncbi:MAG: hypothetical protein ACRC8M_01470 [Cetobacterium sp.]|uniref:hypothetical protein n=1 Tax=Cetobacterium sp. TaxID=2071632 RepID=UPI003F35E5D0